MSDTPFASRPAIFAFTSIGKLKYVYNNGANALTELRACSEIKLKRVAAV
jgi:hypothetical protein